MEDDHTHERALAHFEELIYLRSTFLHHKSVLASIDHAIGNVFEPENHDEISKYVTKIKELVDFVQKMNELGARTTAIEFPLPNLHVSEAKPQYQEVNAKYEKLRDVRQQLAVLGIPTGGVETAMADILMVINIYLFKSCTQLIFSPNRSMAQPSLSRSQKSRLSRNSRLHLMSNLHHQTMYPGSWEGIFSLRVLAPLDQHVR